MKFIHKLLLILIILLNFSLPARSDDFDECKTFFNQYVQKSNNYSPSFPDLFASNALIKRDKINENGDIKHIVYTKPAYVKKLKIYAPLAKLVGYRNNFSNISYQKEGNACRIKGYRTPTTSKHQNYSVSWLIVKDKNGEWKILEDYTETRNKLSF
jgi:hypothetical protein